MAPAALHAPPGPADAAELAQAVEDVMAVTEQVLEGFLTERTARARGVAPACGHLWSDLSGQVGGKLVRPRLTVAAYLGLGGSDPRAVAPVAAAQELLHTAMLVHDDLLDHDELRRGRPNVVGATRARLSARGFAARVVDEQAHAAGLLAGDVALASAFRLVGRAPVEPSVRVELVELLAAGIETAVDGELLDVASALLDPEDSQPLLVAELKTADYSCRLPLVTGAVLARVPEARAGLALVGTALGIAFQVADDELGVFGDPQVTGKSVVSDLREGRRTELLRLAYRDADAAGRAVLDAHVGRPDLDEAGAAAVRAVLVDSGALARTREVAARSARLARELAVATLPAPLAEYLGGVVDDLAGRGR
ncbi:geranylgeranyl pyrophosphate synthase [Cellulomonas soli]|uniref:Geranylgeranyl pyrophosphate synthase n=1 Tax=Cellulomonas soli TaxID=931535 RepID=A0A512PBY2_9CELL|nr:geranylgeranyl pyrophosphate synthase [Cellulomonas soli]